MLIPSSETVLRRKVRCSCILRIPDLNTRKSWTPRIPMAAMMTQRIGPMKFHENVVRVTNPSRIPRPPSPHGVYPSNRRRTQDLAATRGREAPDRSSGVSDLG